MIKHYKDPYETTSRMESKKVFFVAQMLSQILFSRNGWIPSLDSVLLFSQILRMLTNICVLVLLVVVLLSRPVLKIAVFPAASQSYSASTKTTSTSQSMFFFRLGRDSNCA